jgi:hypothetical protein
MGLGTPLSNINGLLTSQQTAMARQPGYSLEIVVLPIVMIRTARVDESVERRIAHAEFVCQTFATGVMLVFVSPGATA